MGPINTIEKTRSQGSVSACLLHSCRVWERHPELWNNKLSAVWRYNSRNQDVVAFCHTSCTRCDESINIIRKETRFIGQWVRQLQNGLMLMSASARKKTCFFLSALNNIPLPQRIKTPIYRKLVNMYKLRLRLTEILRAHMPGTMPEHFLLALIMHQ